MDLPKITTDDICDLSLIYKEDLSYSYSLPENILISFLHGKAFDYPNFYTHDELEKLKADINDLFHEIMSKNPVKNNIAIISAGSPGSGKTTLLWQKLQEETQAGYNYAHVSPDEVCLKGQKRTYVADIEAGDRSKEAREQAYTKWRPGSNAATHLLLANLIRKKYAFYFETTCSSPQTCKFFEFLKKQGYRIKILHVIASDKVRWDSIQERDKTFIQTTEQDIREKGLLVPQRINDTFLKYVDEIEFYYRKEVSQDALLAARWIKNDDTFESLGTLKVINSEAYENVKATHNIAIEILDKPELKWEATIESVSSIL
ncbi:MAG: hypothetical protein K940chlam8_00704 [Chlamydiae bacterium]|nr:hypothetical protein [Chlamydiota bacterium]